MYSFDRWEINFNEWNSVLFSLWSMCSKYVQILTEENILHNCQHFFKMGKWDIWVFNYDRIDRRKFHKCLYTKILIALPNSTDTAIKYNWQPLHFVKDIRNNLVHFYEYNLIWCATKKCKILCPNAIFLEICCLLILMSFKNRSNITQ